MLSIQTAAVAYVCVCECVSGVLSPITSTLTEYGECAAGTLLLDNIFFAYSCASFYALPSDCTIWIFISLLLLLFFMQLLEASV